MFILRRRGLGNTSTKMIQKFLLEDHGKEIPIVRSDAIRGDYDSVLRWGCTASISSGIIINTSKMIHDVNDKIECRKILMNNNVKVPQTFFDKRIAENWLTEVPGRILIGRPHRHAQGRKLVVSKNLDDMARDRTSEYWSEFIDKDKEYRIYTFFGRVTMVAEKVPTTIGRLRVAWNRFGGGASFKNVRWSNWPMNSCKIALEAQKAIGIDFAGIDVMEKDGEAYILELNSAHSLTSEYRQKTFARALNWAIDHININGEKPAHFDMPTRFRNSKDVILPILRDE